MGTDLSSSNLNPGLTYKNMQDSKQNSENAQTLLYQQEQAAKGDITSGYDQGAGEYSLINSVLKDSYASSGAAIGQGYDTASAQVAGGYGAAINKYQPWAKSGQEANNSISDLNGLNGPEAQQAAYQRMQFDPGYKVQVDQANQALQRSSMASGNLFSGNFANALQTQNRNMASTEYGNYYARLMGVSNQGLSASGNQANLYANAGNALGQLSAQKGTALGANYTGYGNAQSNAYGNLANLYANKGTALGNADMGIGSGLAAYQYAGGQNQQNAYSNYGQSMQNAGLGTAGYFKGYNNQPSGGSDFNYGSDAYNSAVDQSMTDTYAGM